MLQISLPTLVCLFALIMVPFDEEKILILTCSNSSVFSFVINVTGVLFKQFFSTPTSYSYSPMLSENIFIIIFYFLHFFMLFKYSCLQPPSTPPTPAIPTLLFYFSNVDIQSTQMAFYVCSEIKDFSKMDIKIEPDVC